MLMNPLIFTCLVIKESVCTCSRYHVYHTHRDWLKSCHPETGIEHPFLMSCVCTCD